MECLPSDGDLELLKAETLDALLDKQRSGSLDEKEALLLHYMNQTTLTSTSSTKNGATAGDFDTIFNQIAPPSGQEGSGVSTVKNSIYVR